MKRTLAAGLMMAGLTLMPVAAQTAPDRSMSGSDMSSSTSMSQPVQTADNDTFDLGWLGLIGLAGLAGLARKRPTHAHTHSTDHVYSESQHRM
jgi:MYXO-CTERM domain-containing protein